MALRNPYFKDHNWSQIEGARREREGRAKKKRRRGRGREEDSSKNQAKVWIL